MNPNVSRPKSEFWVNVPVIPLTVPEVVAGKGMEVRVVKVLTPATVVIVPTSKWFQQFVVTVELQGTAPTKLYPKETEIEAERPSRAKKANRASKRSVFIGW
jgi:hypothetical protein